MENFVIHCVFDGRKGQADFNEMCAFCLKEGIPCVIRPFSHAFEEDRDEIIWLPAYHVFYHNDYELTFYPGDCPVATLGSVRDKNRAKWTEQVFNLLWFTTSKSKTKDMKNN